MSNLAKWLRKYRKKNKLDTTQMGELFKISRQAYEALESPKRKLYSEEQLRQIYRLMEGMAEDENKSMLGTCLYFNDVLFGVVK